MKNLFLEILFTLKRDKAKIRLAIINFNGMIKKTLGEDSMIGLELDL